MKTIYKFTMPVPNKVGGIVSLKLPHNAKILMLRNQRDTPCIWVECDPYASLEERFFESFATGAEIPGDMGVDRAYIGSVLLYDDSIVAHFYERIA